MCLDNSIEESRISNISDDSFMSYSLQSEMPTRLNILNID